MAEIEYFVDPKDKSHPKFARYADLKLPLFSACDQMDGKSTREVSLKDAVAEVSHFSMLVITYFRSVKTSIRSLCFAVVHHDFILLSHC